MTRAEHEQRLYDALVDHDWENGRFADACAIIYATVLRSTARDAELLEDLILYSTKLEDAEFAAMDERLGNAALAEIIREDMGPGAA